MTHENEGHYAAKHSTNLNLNPQITNEINNNTVDGKISCKALHSIAEKFRKWPIEMGKAADLMELKIWKCQLGLFGHGEKNKNNNPIENISQDLIYAIKKSTEECQISCVECWRVAKNTGHHKPHVANACEKLKIKISRCQLGAF